jgi:hypothetical protein
MLTIYWSDGASCLPLDFSLLSSSDEKKRLCDNQKILDKRCCAYRRRKEATAKTTVHLQAMVKRTLSAGIRAKYLLMDSWFTLPSTVTSLSQHLDINRVLSLAVDQLRKIGSYCEKTASTFFDAIIDTALQCVGLSKNDLVLKPEKGRFHAGLFFNRHVIGKSTRSFPSDCQ